MTPEYVPWYQPAVQLLRCEKCGSLVGDDEAHTEWHEKIDRIEQRGGNHTRTRGTW